MNEQKNTLLAIVLSGVVLRVWTYFFGPKLQPDAQKPPQVQAQNQSQGAPTPGAPTVAPPVPGQNAPAAAVALTREAALKQSGDRVAIDTSSLKGSIALKGGRIDDVSLTQYRETIDPNSPAIELLSPSQSPHPYYAEFGWLAATGAPVKVPDRETVWHQEGKDVNALLPHLSVYLGHVQPECTYWYLTATPDLLMAAADRFATPTDHNGGAA